MYIKYHFINYHLLIPHVQTNIIVQKSFIYLFVYKKKNQNLYNEIKFI